MSPKLLPLVDKVGAFWGAEFHFVKGKNNKIADALSRHPVFDCFEDDGVIGELLEVNNQTNVMVDLDVRSDILMMDIIMADKDDKMYQEAIAAVRGGLEVSQVKALHQNHGA